MPVRSTPMFLQAGSHPAEETRLMIAGLLGAPVGSFSGGTSALDPSHGITRADALAVSQNGTPNMSVNVAAGGAFIRGTLSNNQGSYFLWNDGTINLAISAADSTNPRRDLIIAQARDAFYSGASNDARIVVVTGTPAASPSDPSLASFPNALVLARVAVAAGASSIVTANITDLRPRATGLGGMYTNTAANRPTSPPVGQLMFETNNNRYAAFVNNAWQPLESLSAVFTSTANRDAAITSPIAGQMVYIDSGGADEGLWIYDGTTWRYAVPNSNTPLYAARGSGSTTTNIVANTWTTLANYVTEDYDYNNNFNPTTGIYTAPLAGLYEISAHASFIGNNNPQTVAIAITKNDTTFLTTTGTNDGGAAAGAGFRVPIVDCVALAANDTIRIKVWQAGGNTVTMNTSGDSNHFAIRRVNY